jgi:hypothetical protein
MESESRRRLAVRTGRSASTARVLRGSALLGLVMLLGVIVLASVGIAGATPQTRHLHQGGGQHGQGGGQNGQGGDQNGLGGDQNGPGGGQSDRGGGKTAFLRHVTTITFPAPYANPASFDISWVDPTTQAFYLADKTNDGIDAIDGSTDTFGSVIGAGAFVGTNTGSNVTSPAQIAACSARGTGGPNGVLSLNVDGVNQLWAADGVSAAHPVSNVKVFTLSTPTSGTLAATIPTGVAANGTTGTCRADEMAYSPEHHLFLIANDLDSPPYVSLISVNANPALDAVVAQIKFPNAVNGIEQPVWDPETGEFYINIPGVEVAVIDPLNLSVKSTYPTTQCSASGLALDERTQQLLLSCSLNPNGVELMDARNPQITAHFPQVSGADEVWFDPGTRNFYLAASSMTSTGQAISTLTVAGSGTAWTLSEAGATGGTFTLTVGTTTAALPFNASASAVQTALAAIVPGTTVSGGPLPAQLHITFGSAQTTFTASAADLTPSGYATPALGVISAGHSASGMQAQWVTNFPTTTGDHSIAADPVNGQVFVPLQPGLGIGVYAWTTP